MFYRNLESDVIYRFKSAKVESVQMSCKNKCEDYFIGPEEADSRMHHKNILPTDKGNILIGKQCIICLITR